MLYWFCRWVWEYRRAGYVLHQSVTEDSASIYLRFTK